MALAPPTALPRALLDDGEMQAALAAHDFGTVFRLARAGAGISYSKIAAECDIKPTRVGTLARGEGAVTSFDKIVEIADALRVPGHMVGLAPRPWEEAEPTHSPDQQNGAAGVRRRTRRTPDRPRRVAPGTGKSSSVQRTSGGARCQLPRCRRLTRKPSGTVTPASGKQLSTGRTSRRPNGGF